MLEVLLPFFSYMSHEKDESTYVTVCFMGGVGIFVSFLDIIVPQMHPPKGNQALFKALDFSHRYCPLMFIRALFLISPADMIHGRGKGTLLIPMKILNMTFQFCWSFPLLWKLTRSCAKQRKTSARTVGLWGRWSWFGHWELVFRDWDWLIRWKAGEHPGWGLFL